MVTKKTAKKTTTRKTPPAKKSTPRKAATKEAKVVTNAAGNGKKEYTFNELYNREGLILNALLARSNFLESIEGTKRDIDAECGYPATNLLTPDLYYKPFYERHPIAARVVQVLPEESWKVVPDVYETEDPKEETEFERSWNDLALTITGESKLQRKEGSPIWEYLKRADILSGIGTFGVIYLALDDGKDPREEAVPREGQKLLFMRCFDETEVDVLRYETDISSPRFGHPIEYDITFSAPSETGGGIGVSDVTKRVHWTRVIHIADNIGSSEIFGTPRMRPVFNRLWDLRKLYGGSAEMYWKGAFPGLSIETHPHLGGAATVDTTGLKDMIEDYQEGLQRYMALKGMGAKSLAPQVVDPSNQIETQIDAICIQKGIPKRIFMGSERGELASSQDSDTWNERLATRQNTYLTPRVISVFIDRLIFLRVLAEPEEYFVVWPDLETKTDQEIADVAHKQIEAMAKYVGGDVEAIMAPVDLFTKILKMDPEEVEAILEAAVEFEEEQKEKEEEELENNPPPPNQFPPIESGELEEQFTGV